MRNIALFISLLFLASCSQELSEARGLIKKSLKSPDSAYFENEKIILENQYNDGTWYLYSGDVHAKNSFGVTIREHYCVAFKLVSETNQIIHFPNSAVNKCSSPPTEFEIEAIKASNQWGKPPL